MKKLGLIGGTGPISTVLYYQKLIENVRSKDTDGRLPPLVIESVDPGEIFKFSSNRDYAALASYLSTAVNNLAAAGAQCAAFTGMTPHIVFEEVQRASMIPMIHIMDGVAKTAAKLKRGKIALIGSKPTMRASFARKPLESYGISVITPNESEQEEIQAITEKEIEYGNRTEKNVNRMIKIIQDVLNRSGAKEIILANTDLLPYFSGSQIPFEYLDPVELHIQELVKEIMK